MAQSRNTLWYSRMFLIGVWFAVTNVCLLPVSVIRFRNRANNQLFVRVIAKVALKILGLKLEARGSGRDEGAKPCIYVMNHQAGLDILVNHPLYPSDCVVVAKRSLLLVPVFGWIFYLNGNLLLNRKSRVHAISQMSTVDEAIQKQRLSVWIFPEGTRSRRNGLGKLKKGAFHMAVKNQVPIVPVTVSNYFKSVDFTRWRAGRVLIEMHKPIPTVGLTEDDIPLLVEQTERLMRDAIAKLDAELTPQASLCSSESYSTAVLG